MNWNELLCSERLGDKNYQPGTSRSIFVQDHDRIVFSAPFRRLANKTQVQPLYEHDHVHHRLIHSIEVSSVGRSLATSIAAARNLPFALFRQAAELGPKADIDICGASPIGRQWRSCGGR